MKAKDIMCSDVITVSKDTTIKEIANIFIRHNISGVPVVDENRQVLGIVTQKDLLYKDIQPQVPAHIEILGGQIFLNGIRHYEEELKKLVATKAEDIMNQKVIKVDEDTEADKVVQLLVEKDLSRVVVVSGGRLAGIISVADVVKYISGMLE